MESLYRIKRDFLKSVTDSQTHSLTHEQLYVYRYIIKIDPLIDESSKIDQHHLIDKSINID